MCHEIATPELSEDLGEVVAHETVTGGVVLWVDHGHFPAREIRVKAVEKRGVLKGFGKHGEEVLVPAGGAFGLQVDLDVTAEDDRSGGAKFLAKPGEHARLHVVLEDANAGVGVVELRLRDLVEVDDMLGADNAKPFVAPW